MTMRLVNWRRRSKAAPPVNSVLLSGVALPSRKGTPERFRGTPMPRPGALAPSSLATVARQATRAVVTTCSIREYVALSADRDTPRRSDYR
jgi:hypothetical protein